ncbi:glucuronyl hydrolase [Ralstonia insidiosa]|uniref:Glucuronyl hydrolase n=1 Tax=Ralstonia insidiosa TaxID=190721 RepID=A0A191ZWG0_9RALS|nr:MULTISPECIES: hypothetical protein [Ralstonia]ANJ72417.1 glucuronyl hydrolase [Ralstonia insidiosa]KAB0472962.1 glucuronyl hydrolase [Ralstonia insidiosa]MBY4907406.1 glucuronyl hydrolase [Ralstonia insidiosa]
MTTSPFAENDTLSQAEIMAALENLCTRMDAVEVQCGAGFPLYSVGTEDCWVLSEGGSWVGGFWAGCWWLRARLAGVASERLKAVQLCERLAPKLKADSIHRAMLFWYGAAPGARWFGNETCAQQTCAAAEALAASFHPELQCIPTGTAIGGGKHGGQHIGIDALAAVIRLLTLREAPRWQNAARRHTDTVISTCLTEDGACYAEAAHTGRSFTPIGRAGAWSRGQAWAMLGLASAARWGEPYAQQARSACEYWLRSRPSSMPPDRLDQPQGIEDPSAALIAAMAMLSLCEHAGETRWRTFAERQIAAIVRSRYLTKPGNEADGVPAGIFWGACIRTRPDRHELVESAWGSFFLMQALAMLAGKTDAALSGRSISIF